MDSIANDTAGTALIGGGILLFVLMLVVSAVLAPSVGVAAQDDRTRETLVGSQGGGPGWHKYGSVYHVSGNETTWREDSADSYFDVTKLSNGSIAAGFMHSGYQDCGPYEPPCTRTGFRIIDPTPTPRVISEYSFPVRTAKNSEVHDVEPLPSGGFLMTDMEHERIMIVENGKVTWQWNASNLYDPPEDPTKTDWLHINDVDRIGDGRYLVSVRNANQLVVVDHDDGVVEIINKDTSREDDSNCRALYQQSDKSAGDDVRCGDPDVINHQHNPQWLGNGAVLVADSENDRVVELHRTDDGSWEPAWTLERAGGIDLNWPRDADRLSNGNTLITDTLNKRIIEVNKTGKVVWSIETKRIPYEADRLPEGERPTGVHYNPEDADENTRAQSGDVPGLSLLLAGLRGVYPALPFWFGELQLGITLLSLGMVLGGGVLRRRT